MSLVSRRRSFVPQLAFVITFLATATAFAAPPVVPWQPFAGSRQPAAPQGSQGQAPDPVGDTFGSGPVQLDIDEIGNHYDNTYVIVRLHVATPIADPRAFQPDSIVGFIDIDADQNSGTGNPGAVNVFCPQAVPIGVEFEADLFPDPDGHFDIFDVGGNLVGFYQAQFDGNVVTAFIPRSVLGGDGVVSVASVIGTFAEPTDCAPNGFIVAGSPGSDSLTQGIPTLSPLGLAGLALLLLAAAGFVLARRRVPSN